MWRKALLGVAFVGLLLAFRLITAKRPTPASSVRVERPLMGTVWAIEVMDEGRPQEAQKAVNQAFKELERIDQLMSEWKPDSPISAVNRSAGKGLVEVPAELREMIERAIGYSQKTEGTFDITWRGMGRIWHFDDEFVVPKPEVVDKARSNINYREIQIEGNRVGLPRPEMSIGLGGIAKGYAVDRASQVLKDIGFADTLVDGGGDVLVRGTKNGAPWRLGIQDPRAERGSLIGTISLSNAALVTSGDYERYRIVNGVRYHHIIDPRSGWPAKGASSVTILSPSAETAVVLAKAVFILGTEKGLALAKAQNVEALVIDVQGQRHATDGFQRQFHPN